MIRLKIFNDAIVAMILAAGVVNMIHNEIAPAVAVQVRYRHAAPLVHPAEPAGHLLNVLPIDGLLSGSVGWMIAVMGERCVMPDNPQG